MMEDTIAAYSGGTLPGAIGICRISGPQAFALADDLFFPTKGGKMSQGPFYTMRYGQVLAGDGRALDLCLACCYPEPSSYTGEDLLEIFCHGSQAVVACILERAMELGARPAQAGEFTKRAFLAGKLDLTGGCGRSHRVPVCRRCQECSLFAARGDLPAHPSDAGKDLSAVDPFLCRVRLSR